MEPGAVAPWSRVSLFPSRAAGGASRGLPSPGRPGGLGTGLGPSWSVLGGVHPMTSGRPVPSQSGGTVIARAQPQQSSAGASRTVVTPRAALTAAWGQGSGQGPRRKAASPAAHRPARCCGQRLPPAQGVAREYFRLLLRKPHEAGPPPRSYALDGSQLPSGLAVLSTRSRWGWAAGQLPGCPPGAPRASHRWLVVSFHVQMWARPQAPGTRLVSCGSARGKEHPGC